MNAQAHTLEMLQRFLSFDTTSRGSNLPLIHFVRDFLAEHGVASHITLDDSGTKGNLFPRSAPRTNLATSSLAIPTLCPWMASLGHVHRMSLRSAALACMAAVSQT